MKQARLVFVALAVVATAAWTTAFACEKHKQAATASACPATASCPAGSAKCAKSGATAVTAVATSGSQACTAAMAAQCTPAQAAACKAKGAAAAGTAECPYHSGASANAAVTADMPGGSTAHGATAMAAGMTGCSAHGAKAAGMSGCAMHGAAAGAGGCMHGAAAGCVGHEVSTAMAHGDMDCGDCESCAGMASCEKDLETVNTVTQVVRLKNGVMYVYTADSPGHVRTVQSALARRADQWTKLAAAGDKVRLCPPCKEMRGAAASGKLYRETVNIEGGSLTLMTSNDPSMVQRLYAMAGIANGAKAKS